MSTFKRVKVKVTAYKEPKYPRVQVEIARHKKLTIEADKRSMSIRDLVEEKLKSAK